MMMELWVAESGIDSLVKYDRRGRISSERRQEVDKPVVDPPAGYMRPLFIIGAPPPRRILRLLRRVKAREDCSLRCARDELLDFGRHARHPGHRPGPFVREQALHVDAEMSGIGTDPRFELAHGLKARSSGMAQPEWIEEPERYEDQQRYAATQRSKPRATGYPEPNHANVRGDTDSEGEGGRDDERRTDPEERLAVFAVIGDPVKRRRGHQQNHGQGDGRQRGGMGHFNPSWQLRERSHEDHDELEAEKGLSARNDDPGLGQ